jgi:transposase InsO family protein
MVRFIDDHRAIYGVEPICAMLPIAPSTYFRVRAQDQDPTTRPARAKRDDELRVLIQRVHAENFGVYGPRKVWRQLRREGHSVARCTVERLMREMGLAGAVRGRAWKTTTQSQLLLIVRPIWWTARSWPRGRTSCGYRTSPTWRRGPALST